MTKIFLFRHGESLFNADKNTLQGRSDHVSLSDKGREQAAYLGEWINNNNLEFDEVYVSTALRAQDTMRIALRGKKYDPVISSLLHEKSHGEWDGKRRDVYFTEDVIRKMYCDEILTFKPPGGESLLDVKRRVDKWISETVTKQPDKVIAVFSHGTVSKIIVLSVMNWDLKSVFNIKKYNTAFSEIELTDRGWLLHSFNSTPHLERGL